MKLERERSANGRFTNGRGALCCICHVPDPKRIMGGAIECQTCKRGTGPVYAEMRAAYLAGGDT